MINKSINQKAQLFYALLKKIPIAMRITLLLLFVLTFQLQAEQIYSQDAKISLDMKNATIEKVLQTIEEKSDYYFLYNSRLIDVDRKVSVRVRNAPISAVLEKLFNSENVNYEVKGSQIILSPKEMYSQITAVVNALQQQKKTITGTIVDEAGEPIIGANIVEVGTTNGTVTDVDGKFSLNVDNNATIHISYIGYLDQEFAIGNQTTLNVVLSEDTELLEEVVVVGYGTQRKETLTGSIASISASDITTTKTENLINNIQGKVPGLLIRQQSGEPGTFNNAISIRGYGEPMIVIDGIVRNGTSDLAQLNSNDIESISVLKDASAAIYGLGAANGVIIVTTKKGVSGKTSISYSGIFGVKTPTAIEPTVDAITYYKLANEININDKQPITYSDEFIQKYVNKEPGYEDFDWYDLFMKDYTVSNSHNISVRGGTDRVKYFTSFGYDDDEGLLVSDIQYYKRYNMRGTITADLTNDLKLNFSTSARIDDTRRTREAFLWNYKTLLVNERGKGWHTIANEKHFTDLAPESKNIAALIDPDVDGYNLYKNRRYQTTFDLEYTFPTIKGLSAGVSGAYDYSTWYAQSVQKSYSLYDYYTDEFTKTFGADNIRNEMQMQQRTYGRAQVNYENSWNNHNFSGTFVTEFNRSRGDYLSGGRNYTELFTKDILDQGSASTATNSGNRNIQAEAAYLARINYDYSGKYLLELIGRYDGTYRYAPGKRWAFFPSVSAGWRISEEDFIKNNLPIIGNLKLRGSYGKTGTNTGSAFQYIPGYTNSGLYSFNGSSVTTGMRSNVLVSDRLTWVTSLTKNVGIDWDLWDGKLGGNFDLFERKNTGLLANRQQTIPTDLLGASFSQENLNSNLNHGFEFGLSHRNIVNKDFSYTVGANFTYARTKTLHSEGSDNYNNSMDIWHNSTENRYEGRYTGWNAAGNWTWLPGILSLDGVYTSLEQYENGPLYNRDVGNSMMLPGSWKVVDLNGDGLIDRSDVSYDHWNVGSNPPIQFGFTYSMVYKNFDMNLLLQGAAGHSIQFKLDDIWGYGRYPSTYKKYLDRWHTAEEGADPFDPNTEWISGFWPALRSYNTYNYYTLDAAGTDRQIIPATYLRLKSLEIGYTIEEAILKRIGIDNCRIFLTGYNLFTLCNDLLKGADPEKIEGDWNAGLTYPLMRTYNFGINLNF
jgi:TonB-linked SusC/RagA family outer membrane protein